MNFMFELWRLLFPKKETVKINNNIVNNDIVKKAICIGINNYPGAVNDLRGCVNDAKGWKKLLTEMHQYSVILLLDGEASIRNVINHLKEVVKGAKDGDSIVITFSGHGTTKPDTNGDETDGKDEALCLFNGLLLDDTIRKILNNLSKGVKFTFISDSCHSGTVTRSFMSARSNDNTLVPKFLPPKDEIDATNLELLPINKAVFVPQKNMQEILISGCKSNEYSYDASFNGKSMGALSHYALLILRDNKDITYADFYKKLKKYLPSSRYPQTPQLEGSVKNKNTIMF